ncbi:hypothetical protein G3T20_11495 [Bordetella hinzii]|nr:hypothetical protein G3T20_11495 [Bordetella hinzii]
MERASARRLFSIMALVCSGCRTPLLARRR